MIVSMPLDSARAACALAPALALVARRLLWASAAAGAGDDGDRRPATPPRPRDADEIDVRRYLGPDYCPEIRIREGTELVRRYERGHEDDPDLRRLAGLDRQDGARVPLRRCRAG